MLPLLLLYPPTVHGTARCAAHREWGLRRKIDGELYKHFILITPGRAIRGVPYLYYLPYLHYSVYLFYLHYLSNLHDLSSCNTC
ncbi:hypothetical protein J6590_103087 [Homalodisca vitripennis]|nr:hypothetical protein J6590_103087 [Homalodisca vitripennis]